MNITTLSLVEIFKYMTKFITNIIVIKDICEIINDSLVIVNYFLLLQIGPKNLGNIFKYL
jgi:hypothetical protein